MDTPEPDEKSIITYVSQLYDVFPEPPSGHPLFDAEGQKKLSSFKELASSLNAWIRESIAIMQASHFKAGSACRRCHLTKKPFSVLGSELSKHVERDEASC